MKKKFDIVQGNDCGFTFRKRVKPSKSKDPESNPINEKETQPNEPKNKDFEAKNRDERQVNASHLETECSIHDKTFNSGTIKDSVIPLKDEETPVVDKGHSFREENLSHSSSRRRRSSLNMRGKRTSSVHHGLCGPPHSSVDSKDFYRHIDVEQSEPVKMRQLLVWCSQRAMMKENQKEYMNPIVSKILLELQEDIVQQMIAKQINLSWYHRKPSETENDKNVIRISHPQNIDNQAKIEMYKKTLESLHQKIQDWTQTMKAINNEHAAFLDQCESEETNIASLVENISHVANGQVEYQEINDSLKVINLADLDNELDPEELEQLASWNQNHKDTEDKYANELKEKLLNLKLELACIQNSLLKQNGICDNKRSKFCQDLYTELRRAYQEREFNRSMRVEPQEILKMLATNPSSSHTTDRTSIPNECGNEKDNLVFME